MACAGRFMGSGELLAQLYADRHCAGVQKQRTLGA
jgi:hypothetical protein